MQCFFMRGGHIASVKELFGLSDKEATETAHHLFSELEDSFDGFELWDRSRVIIRFRPISQDHWVPIS